MNRGRSTGRNKEEFHEGGQFKLRATERAIL